MQTIQAHVMVRLFLFKWSLIFPDS
jgi:hypothetical protein